MHQRRKLNSLLTGILVGALSGCQPANKEQNASKAPIDPSVPIVKTETHQKECEASIAGRSYTPGFSYHNVVRVSHSSYDFDSNHSHNVPIDVSQPDRFHLFFKIDGRVYKQEVDARTWRDSPDGQRVKVHYNEKRISSYKQGAELEKLSDNFEDLEITSFEPID